MDGGDDSDALGPPAARPSGAPFPDDARLERFEDPDHLGPSRTVGDAFRAYDREAGTAVVLRVIPTEHLRDPQLQRFRRQASTDPEDGGQGLFRTVVEANGAHVLVRPFLEGEPLSTYLGRSSLPLDEALHLVEAILTDLEHAHEHGIVHGNLDPRNVIVPPGDAFQSSTVVDHGLRRTIPDAGDAGSMSPQLARYISPEGAGLIDAPANPASDLYAVGLLLYEALTGRFPYDGGSFSDVLRAHVTEDAEPLRRRRPDLPRSIDQVLRRLLRPHPRERYQTTGGLLADIRKIRTAIQEGQAPDIVVGSEDPRQELTEPGFLDRERELAALEREIEQAGEGKGGVTVVEAVSGGGKTRLLEEFVERGPLGAVRTFEGQVHEDVAQRPFQALRGVVDGLIQRAREDPREIDRLRRELGPRAQAVCRAFPALADVLDITVDATQGPDEYGEERTLAAMATLLDALGAPEHPALVVIDDCQWIDELTGRLLHQWSHRLHTEGLRHTSVVIAYRSDEVPEGDVLRRIDPSAKLSLPLFEPEQVASLVRSMAGPVPSDAIDVVVDLSEGNPFMATAVLRGLIEAEALVSGPEGWEIRREALDAASAAEHAAAFLHHRLRQLPREDRKLLTAGAILGKAFDLPTAAELSGTPIDDARRITQRASDRRILWPEDDEDRLAFAHDKLRETLLDALSPRARRSLHHQAALRLEDEDEDRVFDLAYHFHAAGDADRAYPYALPAAREARDRYALETAVTYYRIAADGVAPDDREAQLAIQDGLGEALMLQGEYEAAQDAFEQARHLVATDAERTQVQGKLGELAFKRGDMASSAKAVEAALRTLGERVPSSTLGYVVLLVWELIVQTMHSLLPGLTTGREEPGEDALHAVRLYSRLTYVSWYHKGPIPTMWSHLRELNLAERYGPTPELAQAYATHAPVMTQIPWFDRGDRYAQRGIEIGEAVEDGYAEGAARHFRGLVLYAASRYEEALETLRAGERLLDQTGDRWQANNAGFHIAFCLYRLGRLEEAVDKAREVYEAADLIGDLSTLGLAAEVWAKAADGDVPEEVIENAVARVPIDDAQTYEAAFQAKGRRCLAQGDLDAALDAFDRAEEVADDAGLRSEYVAPIPAWRATVLRQQAEEAEGLTPHRRQALVDEARSTARQASHMAFFYPNNRPHAYRERGLVAAMRGRGPRARRWLDRSLEAAQEQDATVEQAFTLAARARVGDELGWDTDEDRAQAEQLLSTARPTRSEAAEGPTLSLVDRFSGILEWGRRIAACLSEDTVYETICGASIHLLRGQRCHVFEIEDGEPVLRHVHGDPDNPVDLDLVEAALEERAVVTEQARGLQSTQGPASHLALPIEVQDEIVAVAYLSHTEVSELFGRTEERLAAFIAEIGGAALENARNVQELEALTQTLEDRVTARTAELEDRLEQQAHVAEIGREALELDDLDALIRDVCQVVNDTLAMDLTNVLELQEDAVVLREGAGWPREDLAGKVSAKLDRGSQAGYTALQDGPVISNDLQNEDRFTPHPMLLEAGVEASASTVIPGREAPWGVLAVHARSKGAVSEHDANFVQSVANVLGAAIQRALSERELARYARRLEQSNEEWEQFGYVVSHDLQEPIRMVNSYLQLLSDRYGHQLDEDADEFIDYAVEGALRMRELIQGLLQFARVDTRGGEKEEVDAGDVLEDVLADLSLRIEETGARIEHDELPTVVADAAQLRQVLQNLLSNAIKFVPEDREPHIRITTEKERDRCVFHVQDNGVGIDPDYQDKIFTIFRRLHDRGTFDGQGVGLAVARKIVERHEGRIWVTSDPGEGSTFHFTLPAPDHTPVPSERLDLPGSRSETETA